MKESITVAELIAVLQKYPGTMPVFLDGYENGYDPVDKLKVQDLVFNPSGHWFEGVYLTPEERDEQMVSPSSPIPARGDEKAHYIRGLVLKAKRGVNEGY